MEERTVEKVMQTMAARPAGRVYPVAAIQAVFGRLQARCPALRLLLLSTSEGRTVADWCRVPADPRRLSAMSNSFLTLGETVVRELDVAPADYATVCTPAGNMVFVRILAGRPFTLAALAGPEASLGAVLVAVRDGARQLGEILQEPATHD